MARFFTPETVEAEFAGRALEHAWLHHKPLLREPLDTDHTVIVADGTSTYQLIDPTVDLEALGRMTYLEYHLRADEFETFEEFCT